MDIHTEWVSLNYAEISSPFSRSRLRALVASGELRSIESGKGRRKVNLRDLERLIHGASDNPDHATIQAA